MSGYTKMLEREKSRENLSATTTWPVSGSDDGGFLNSEKSPSGNCPCKRPRARVLCSACGFITAGRVRYPCEKHGNVIFINDYSKCPMCRVHDFMLVEF